MDDSDSSGEVRSEEVLALRNKFPTKIPVSRGGMSVTHATK
jgi:hypothetical protein